MHEFDAHTRAFKYFNGLQKLFAGQKLIVNFDGNAAAGPRRVPADFTTHDITHRYPLLTLPQEVRELVV